MGIVRNILCTYGVVSKQHEANKKNQNPYKRRIQEIKGTKRTVIDCSSALSWSWLLCM